MAYVQADLDNIRQCIASGILETRYADGRWVKYQSLADMMTAEQRIAASITSTSGCGRPRRRTPAYRDGN